MKATAIALSPTLAADAVPRATYRIQFHAGMRFDDATRAVPYLRALGISHLYASPYLKARAGSTHGYDIVDHHALNPEIGDANAHARLCDTLAEHGMRQLLDIVPNHMGVLEADNAWWLDVLECGPASIHACTFDIDWSPPAPELRGRVLLPVLGDHYGRVLENGELKLVFAAGEGTFAIHYHGHRFPIDPQTYPQVFAAVAVPVSEDMAAAHRLVQAFAQLPLRDTGDAAARERRLRDKAALKRQLAERCRAHAGLRAWVVDAVERLNGHAGQAASFDALDGLIRAQAYRLAFWRVASDDVNYRRFFDINTLAALRTERPEVFEATHRTVLQWLREGRIHGLRIDHPDGLCDPLGYFERLQASGRQGEGAGARVGVYVLVEKILAEHERLPDDWPVHGDTGYRFGVSVGGLFVDAAQEAAMNAVYARHIGQTLDFDAVLYQAKRLIMASSLAGDLQLLTEALYRIARADRRTCDFTRNRLRGALVELAAGFPVYRSYIGERGVSDTDRQHIDWATAAAKRRSAAAEVSAIDFAREVLLHAPAEPDAGRRRAMLDFVYRWQQFTAPVMAKAMEDTSFYRHFRLVSLNEVGGDPRRYGTSVEAFHGANQQRARFLPHCLLGTSTHDTKRSEDVRARIAVLSELPAQWDEALRRWSEINRGRAERAEAEIEPNDAWLLYQTLVGVWPLEPVTDAAALDALRQRVQAYMLKAVREAKLRTSWINPDAAYEGALQRLIDQWLGMLSPNPFLKDFLAFLAPVAAFGAWNSLNQVVFKLTAPGVPDLYQGCERWDFSLVDPDNRRPVDFEANASMLASLTADVQAAGDGLGGFVAGLRETLPDGRLKLYVTWRLLQLRAAREAVFREGAYQPLAAEGDAAGHVVAYARGQGRQACVVIGSRLLWGLAGGDPAALDGAPWAGTRVALPEGERGAWRDVLTGRRLAAAGGGIALDEALAVLPFAVLVWA